MYGVTPLRKYSGRNASYDTISRAGSVFEMSVSADGAAEQIRRQWLKPERAMNIVHNCNRHLCKLRSIECGANDVSITN